LALEKPLKLALHTQILIGLILGLLCGLIINVTDIEYGALGDFLGRLNEFVGDLFIRALRFVAIPVVVFSLIFGAGGLGGAGKLGRIGLKTFLLYLATTAIAISIGLLLANVIQPGSETFVSQELRDSLAAAGADRADTKIEKAVAPDVWSTLLNIVPKNPFKAFAEGNMLQIVFFSLIVGLGLNLIPRDLAQPVLKISEAVTEVMVKLIQLLMRLAPIAVFALIAKVAAALGLDVIGGLLVYTLVVISGLLLMTFVVYPLFLILLGPGKQAVFSFYKSIFPAQLLAFSSSSSAATMPVTMECMEKNMKARPDVVSFVVPLGATVNMDGTALYQGVAVIFIAQLFGIPLDVGDQLTIILTATLASIGTAGVPGVGLIMLVIVLESVGMGDVIRGGIAIILGVDRILDMCRTVCNVTGDCMVTSVISHSETGRELLTHEDATV